MEPKTWEEFQKDEITMFALCLFYPLELNSVDLGFGQERQMVHTQVQSLYNNKLLNPHMNSAIISLVWSNDFVSRFMVFAC